MGRQRQLTEGLRLVRLEQLEYLVAVTRHGSVRRASAQLHVSQPAMSQALHNLERELGVTLLERRRSGARISPHGAELLSKMQDVLDAAERLRVSAQAQDEATRMVRVGTVHAGTSAIVLPGLRAFSQDRPRTVVQIESVQHHQAHERIAEGSLDLALVNVLPGDDVPPSLQATSLVTGRPVVCLRADHALAQREAVQVQDLLQVPLVGMRAGYVMHRYVHRLLGADGPQLSCSTDGAEMGKLMVAEGLGVTVLPDYSVIGDPLANSGVITHRPIAGDDTTVELLLLRRRDHRRSAAVAALEDAFQAAADRLVRGERE